ncbi:hypothetical protein DRJ48_05010 [Candidatus Woesearchaeota archaeon]|nr:MAG: hypothetical protein DRJ48_05010 [Candidatus Woesearchaeota archaeon]
MIKRVWLLIILLGLFLSFNCFAASPVQFSADFSAYTYERKYETCSCRDIEYNITVVNTGDFVAAFTLYQSGYLAKYATIVPNSFVLEPKQTAIARVFVRVPCNIKGRFPLKTIIANDMNVMKSFTQYFLVKACSNIDVNLTFSTPEGCRCDRFEYNLMLHNPGVFEEVYSLEVPGVNATFSENNITIAGNSSRFITLAIVPPCAWGGRQVPLKIRTKYTQQEKSIKLPLNVNTNCSALPYTPPSWGYLLWVIIGLAALILVMIILITCLVIRKRRGVKKRPGLVKLRFKESRFRRLPWLKLLVVVVLLVVWGLAAYFAYVYLPKIFAGAEKPVSTVSMFQIAQNETINQTGLMAEPHQKQNYWVYFWIALAVLLVAEFVFYLASQYRESTMVRILRRVTLVLLTLLVLAGLGVYLFAVLNKHWDKLWNLVWGFLVLYYPYIILGIGILLLILGLSWLRTRLQTRSNEALKTEAPGFICEFCGREFKTRAGLERHIKAKH